MKTFYVPSHGQRQRSMHSNGWSSVLIEVGIKGADQICVPLHLRTDFPRVTAKSYSICSRLESRSTSLIVDNDAVQSVATDLYFNHVFLFVLSFNVLQRVITVEISSNDAASCWRSNFSFFSFFESHRP